MLCAVNSKQLAVIDGRLEDFLSRITPVMGRVERRQFAKTYVSGLLLDGDRKSIEPMAARMGHADGQALQQFVSQSPWSSAEVQRRVLQEIVTGLGEPEVWVIDETSFPKAGGHSVGVARQDCGALGKIANCQVAVSLHWAGAHGGCPVGWKLFLPESWLEDAERARRAGIPAEVKFASKGELALALVDEALAAGLPPAAVTADSFSGDACDFRAALRERGLPYALKVEPSTGAWEQNPAVPVVQSGRGRPRKHPHLPDPRSLGRIAAELPVTAWQEVQWRVGTKGPQCSRFALLEVWASHDWKRGAEAARPSEWLLLEWPAEAASPSDYWICHGGTDQRTAPELRRQIQVAKARWRIEQDYRELKEELGLDHFEGRSWLGWQHHVTLVTIAFAFLRLEQARAKKNFWCDFAPGAPPDANLAHPPSPLLPVVPNQIS